MSPTINSRTKAEYEDRMGYLEQVSDKDIHFSRLTGMSPDDIDVLCDFTRERALLMITRCPKRPARYFHGKFQPKPQSLQRPSDASTGLAEGPNGVLYVSDYDLMSVWEFLGEGHYRKIFFSELVPGVTDSFTPLAKKIFDDANERLRSPLQHGAQDDYYSTKNPGVRPGDRYIAFNVGNPIYFCNSTELQEFYEQTIGTDKWPYDTQGQHRSRLR